MPVQDLSKPDTSPGETRNIQRSSKEIKEPVDSENNKALTETTNLPSSVSFAINQLLLLLLAAL